jgi:hypothetical protein
MSTPILKLIYKNKKNKTKKNNTNNIIQNAILKTKLKTETQVETHSNTIKNTKKNKKDKKNNLTKRKKIKKKPQILLESTDPNNMYVVMITSKSELNDSRKKGNTYINWLSIVNSDNSDTTKEDDIIPYKIQKKNKGIYKFKIHLYSLSNNENVTEKINNIKDIINTNIKKCQKNNDYTEILNNIEPLLGKNLDNREFIINTKYNKYKRYLIQEAMRNMFNVALLILK